MIYYINKYLLNYNIESLSNDNYCDILYIIVNNIKQYEFYIISSGITYNIKISVYTKLQIYDIYINKKNYYGIYQIDYYKKIRHNNIFSNLLSWAWMSIEETIYYIQSNIV